MITETRILSEAFQEALGDRRLVSAVFTTFQYDPVFFEQEILPIFFDAHLSHIPAVRAAQLQLSLRSLPGQIVVFYDSAGLLPEKGTPRLDVRNVPVKWRSGIFHPKNVFLLVEGDTDEGPRRSLITACLSGNLTRSGWWENVECCHLEEIGDGEATSLRDPMLELLAQLGKLAQSENAREALKDLSAVLRRSTQRLQRTQDGALFTQLFSSAAETFPDFLENAAGKLLRGCSLEVISPYFDDADECRPLKELKDRFKLEAIRVAVPTNRQGEAAIRPALFESVKALGVDWAHLPSGLTGGGGDQPRFVHAKLYRFFEGTSEYVFVGSANCTSPAHSGANFETGFLVEVPGHRRREFILEKHRGAPPAFAPKAEGEPAASEGSTSLQLRYRWDTGLAEALWVGKNAPPRLQLQDIQGIHLFELETPKAEWTPLDATATAALRQSLERSAFVRVLGESPTSATLLVQQEGMTHAPSLVLTLSVAEILEFWARATEDQRRVLLEARILEKHPELQNDLVVAMSKPGTVATFFDRFAGYFQAFNALERRVRSAKERNHRRDAVYALFSKQYDSLRAILERVVSSGETIDTVDRYVLLLTAEQTLSVLEREWPELFAEHRADQKELLQLIERKVTLGDELSVRDPSLRGFLGWFEKHFTKRVAPRGEALS